MVLVSYSGREINAKLVYYGPGLSGKTTNLEYIYGSIPPGQRGKMVSMKTKTERTLFFDFLPVNLGELSGFKTRFLLYTVPGQVYYNATRKLVLKGVDAVVFVADSKRGKMDENVESLENLRENLKEHGLGLDQMPLVLQYNKRDLADVYTLAELEAVLNPNHVPAYEAVATTGQGVVDTFKGISRLLLKNLAADIGVIVKPAQETAPVAAGAPAIAPPREEPALSWTASPLSATAAAAVPAPQAPLAPGVASPATPPPLLRRESGVIEAPPLFRTPEPPVSRRAPEAEAVPAQNELRDLSAGGRNPSVGERLRRWLSRPAETEAASDAEPVRPAAASTPREPNQGFEPAGRPEPFMKLEPLGEPVGGPADPFEQPIGRPADPIPESVGVTTEPAPLPGTTESDSGAPQNLEGVSGRQEPDWFEMPLAPGLPETPIPEAASPGVLLTSESAQAFRDPPCTPAAFGTPPAMDIEPAISPAAAPAGPAEPGHDLSHLPAVKPLQVQPILSETKPAIRVGLYRQKQLPSHKAREVIVPLVLEPEDLERGIVLRLAIQAPWLEHEPEDEQDGELPNAA